MNESMSHICTKRRKICDNDDVNGDLQEKVYPNYFLSFKVEILDLQSLSNCCTYM